MNTHPQLQQEIENHKKVIKFAIRLAIVLIVGAITMIVISQTTTEDPSEPTPPRTPPITPMQEHYNALDTFQYSDDSKGTSRFDWDARKRGILINN